MESTVGLVPAATATTRNGFQRDFQHCDLQFNGFHRLQNFVEYTNKDKSHSSFIRVKRNQ